MRPLDQKDVATAECREILEGTGFRLFEVDEQSKTQLWVYKSTNIRCTLPLTAHWVPTPMIIEMRNALAKVSQWESKERLLSAKVEEGARFKTKDPHKIQNMLKAQKDFTERAEKHRQLIYSEIIKIFAERGGSLDMLTLEAELRLRGVNGYRGTPLTKKHLWNYIDAMNTKRRNEGEKPILIQGQRGRRVDSSMPRPKPVYAPPPPPRAPAPVIGASILKDRDVLLVILSSQLAAEKKIAALEQAGVDLPPSISMVLGDASVSSELKVKILQAALAS